jgi:hypothetical protein
VRYTNVGLDLNASGPLGLNPSGDEHRDWVDPIIGVNLGIDLTRHWAIAAEGDVGGFGIGSGFTWNALGLLSYQTSVFSDFGFRN